MVRRPEVVLGRGEQQLSDPSWSPPTPFQGWRGQMRKWFFYETLIVSCVVVVGCGHTPGSGKPRSDVTITIAYAGQPVSDGVVELVHQQTGEGGGGKLTVDGVATLPRVALGSYTVLVKPPYQTAPPIPPAQGQPARQDEMKERTDIPEKFRRAATSPLKLEVTDRENNFQFDLTESGG